MKPAFVINRGETFVTLRATTDRPAEIREAIATREVQHVFKGDQNQAWDAVLANHCLARAIGDEAGDDTELTFFIQDERLGTADARIARRARAEGRRYLLTEDYYRGRAGAVWEHQDVSHGLFFTEAVSPEQYQQAGLHLHRAAIAYERHAAELASDCGLFDALRDLGVELPTASRELHPDAATGLGPVVEPAILPTFMEEHPDAALYYAFTKTDGLYGLAPVEDDNVTLSSIPAEHPELQEHGRRLLLFAAKGAMREAGSSILRRGVKQRARRLAQWARETLEQQPGLSVADMQVELGRWLTSEVFPADRLELDRTSRFTHVSREDLPKLRDLTDSLHFFLDLAMRHPQEFTDSYNSALNEVGYGLQRVKYDYRTGHFTPPFFVELAPDGPNTPLYRYGIEMTGVDKTRIRLTNETIGDLHVEASGAVRNLQDFARALLDGLPTVDGVSLVGKAAAFAAELQRSPRGLGLPRQGSKYTPMVDHFLAGLRARGVLKQAPGLRIRIGLNALDHLSAMGELPLRLPRFLHGAMGRDVNCRDFAESWRRVSGEARALLESMGRVQVGQHVHLARLFMLNARRADLQAACAGDARLSKLVHQLGGPADEAVLRLGRELSETVYTELQRLLEARDTLLAERRTLVDQARVSHTGGRLVPDPKAIGPLNDRLGAFDCALQLLTAAYIRRLWQRAESLPYLNDRPYTLALYLLFGMDIFPPICRNVEFDVEYISRCLTSTGIEAPCEAEACAVPA